MMKGQRSFGSRLLRAASLSLLCVIYGGAIILADFIGVFTRRVASRQNGVLMLTATFHNPNWYFAHVAPLARSGFRRIIVVADGHVGQIPGVEVVVPPAWLSRIVTRAGAKFLVLLWLSVKMRPSMVMGYHIFPAAVMALLAGRVTGAKTGYQVTSGPLELEGGGWHAENRVLTGLGWPSPVVERLALALTRRFDLVVVRGTTAHSFVRDRCGYGGELTIITGSVAGIGSIGGQQERDNDVLFVGRLAEYKRPDRFARAMVKIAAVRPDVRALVVGDGPDRADLEELITREGLSGNVRFLGVRTDVPSIMARSRVLVQTSRWEGVSIAVLEAMMHGLVPVVSDVGDLRDVIVPGETGFLVSPDDVDSYAKFTIRLLADPVYWATLSRACHQRALDSFSTEVVAGLWRDNLLRVGACS